MEYYKRSPFLFSSWTDEDKIILYNYNEFTKTLVSKEVMKIVDMLSSWMTIQEVSDKLQINKKILTSALQHLARLHIVDKNNFTKENPDAHFIKLWDPIELAMQRQRSYGGIFSMANRIGKSPKPIKHMEGISSINLPVPHNTAQNIDGLLGLLEERRTIRRYSSSYITLEKLSDFLYHSARVRKVIKTDQGTVTQRPYPSGGARYALEIYVLNNRIRDLQKGIHFYDPLYHRLSLISENSTYRRKFNRFMRDATSSVDHPDVGLVITAVFARTMWKYDKLGLSLILSDLGGLYQTMYLVATHMKLAPCPIGGTHEQLVKKWLNLNWFEESHIGTFLLSVPENNTKKGSGKIKTAKEMASDAKNKQLRIRYLHRN